MPYIRAERKNKKESSRSKGWVGFYNKEHPTGKEVVQLSLTNDFLTCFESMSIASHKAKVNIGNISKCCNRSGYRKSAGGFKWMFASEYFID